MDETARQILNLHVIRSSFRVAAEAYPEYRQASTARAQSLLDRARQVATDPTVIDTIAAVRAEIEGHAVSAHRNRG